MLNFIQSITTGISAILDPVGTISADVINRVFTLLVSSLPDGGQLPQGVHDGAIYFGNALSKLNFIMPVDILISCLVIILTLKITLFGFHIFMWVINWFRGVATAPYDGGMLPDEGYATVAQRTAKFWG